MENLLQKKYYFYLAKDTLWQELYRFRSANALSKLMTNFRSSRFHHHILIDIFLWLGCVSTLKDIYTLKKL